MSPTYQGDQRVCNVMRERTWDLEDLRISDEFKREIDKIQLLAQGSKDGVN